MFKVRHVGESESLPVAGNGESLVFVDHAGTLVIRGHGDAAASPVGGVGPDVIAGLQSNIAAAQTTATIASNMASEAQQAVDAAVGSPPLGPLEVAEALAPSVNYSDRGQHFQIGLKVLAVRDSVVSGTRHVVTAAANGTEWQGRVYSVSGEIIATATAIAAGGRVEIPCGFEAQAGQTYYVMVKPLTDRAIPFQPCYNVPPLFPHKSFLIMHWRVYWAGDVWPGAPGLANNEISSQELY